MRFEWFKLGVFLVLITIGFSPLSFAQSENEINLFAIAVNGRAGLVNRAGEIVIKPEFMALGDVNADCECIWAMDENHLWGTIDLHGKWIIRPRYTDIASGGERYSVAREHGKLSKYRFIDNFGNTFFDAYDDARPFSEGLAAVKVKNRWGYIDTQGKYVILPQYNQDDETRPWMKGLAGDFSEGLAVVERNSRRKYIRRDNTVAFELDQGTYGGNFKDGRAIIRKDEKAGIIDIHGKIILPPTYIEIEGFADDLAAFRNGVLWGYLNKEGMVVINPIFESADAFDSGLAPARFAGKWGFIDTTGKFVIEPKYEEVGTFQNGLANVEQNGEELFIDRTGAIVIKCTNLRKSH